ncbi:MAG: hypothetical protein U0792_11630 [Gemmataceae bacterium]
MRYEYFHKGGGLAFGDQWGWGRGGGFKGRAPAGGMSLRRLPAGTAR